MFTLENAGKLISFIIAFIIILDIIYDSNYDSNLCYCILIASIILVTLIYLIIKK